MADSSYYQGDYIRHPVLYELSHKYGLQTESLPESALPYKLEELKEHIRKEIRKELKIKEGAEKLREVAKDRKSLSDVAHIVKKSNSKLNELQAELQELESQIILTQGQSSDQHSPKNGHDGLLSPMSGMSVENQGPTFSSDHRLLSLEKQLNIELKVKHGAENMLQSLANSGHSRDKKLIGEAQQMLADSKAKIEFLKMRILKVKQNKANSSRSGNDTASNGDSNNRDKLGRNLDPPSLEDRVEELRHRLRIEAAVVEGAKNVIRLLQSSKVADKKALQENKALRRSPARLKHRPKRTKSGGDLSQSRSAGGASSSDGKKNPRTVHIDVYCTGSESSDSSNSTEEESNSTPQTVFESDRLRVTHQRAHSDSLPHSLQRQKRCVLSNQSIPSVSSGYPSAMSSLVSGTDGFSLTSGSFLSSGVASSAAVTSAKDTDFSSRDSFDYDNSFDKLRIREKERLWAAQRAQGAMLEESSDSSSDSEEGMAWSFERGNFLKREDTVKRPPDSLRKSSSAHVELSKSGSLSDSEACSLKYKRDSIKKPYESIFHNLSKAKKFGPIISSLKKPGHHVGPSKNPNCTCDTCRYFFEHVCCRNRTRSLGDRPL